MPDESQGPGVSPHTNPLSAVAWMNEFILFILTIPSLSITVFLRRQFGCRYMKLWMVLVAAILLWTVFSLSFSMDVTPARLFTVAMVGLAIYHSRIAWKRFWSAAGKPELLWHSMSDGLPYLRDVFPNASDRLLKVVLEPAATMIVGLVCLGLGAGLGKRPGDFFAGFAMLGLWLLTAATCHALYEAMLYEQRLHTFIDLVDQNIEAASLMEVKTGFIDGKQTHTPKPEDLLGNPVLFTPDLFGVMENARKRAKKAKAAAASA